MQFFIRLKLHIFDNFLKIFSKIKTQKRDIYIEEIIIES